MSPRRRFWAAKTLRGVAGSLAIVLLTLNPRLAPCPVKMSEMNSSFLDS